MNLSNLRVVFPAVFDIWTHFCVRNRLIANVKHVVGARQCSSSTTSSSTETKDSVNSDEINPNFINRNPRNLELMNLAKKRRGWKFQYPARDFYHRLHFERTNRHITARVEHFSGVTVVSASTRELAIMRHLYSTSDVSAAVNIGRVLAQRCQLSGITSMVVHEESSANSSKFDGFREALEKAGIQFTEGEVITREYLPGIDYDNQEEVDNLIERQKRVAKLGRWSRITKRMEYMRNRSRNHFNGRPKSKISYV